MRDLGAFGKSKPNQCEPNQITCRQGLLKVCVQQFDCQDEDQFRIFKAILVQFVLGIMLEEGICKDWIFGFKRSKSLNLEA